MVTVFPLWRSRGGTASRTSRLVIGGQFWGDQWCGSLLSVGRPPPAILLFRERSAEVSVPGRSETAMPHYQIWEEFTRAAEKLYVTDPMKVRVLLKYRHCDGNLSIKVTDNAVCLLYRTDQAQDVKKIEKFHSQLMRLMVTKESRSVAMETN